MSDSTAPGYPGISPRWTTSAKDGVGTAINPASTLAFTLSHGILNEVYFPREDMAAIRDLGLLVTNGTGLFVEEKRDMATSTRQPFGMGIPAYKITNTCPQNRFSIVKELVTDPLRYTLLQRVTFRVEKPDDYRLYALLAPHLNNVGEHNTAWVGSYKGHRVLFARNGDVATAMLCSPGWARRSVGFVGYSDGWQQLHAGEELNEDYTTATDGNVALTGEIKLEKGKETTVVIALGFGETPEEAAHHALSSLLVGFDTIQKYYVEEWKGWHDALKPLNSMDDRISDHFRLSASVLRAHQSKSFPGAIMASLSIPWGNKAGDSTNTGYHLIWPRDLVECAGALLELGAHDDALRTVNYLMTTQEEDGHWSQNMWVGGTPSWRGIQLDETALPILLIDRCRELGLIPDAELPKYWVTVSKATRYLLTHGLITEQERWEEQSGICVYTVATTIAAMLAAADLAEAVGETDSAKFCRETADCWNEAIDTWLYVHDTRLCKEQGVEGYYLRVNPTKVPADELGVTTFTVKNKPAPDNVMPIVEMVSVDALALVRFGLRSATDIRITNTLKVIDATLKADLPTGTSWHRYVNDGYGEHADGSAYNGTGIGRPWPLLAGERAHYEIAAGNPKYATKLLADIERFSNNGLLSEQLWDQADIPEKGLYRGKHSGSAMPLAWAHAEHVKLVCSLHVGHIVDMPLKAKQRYLDQQAPTCAFATWRENLPITVLPVGMNLRIVSVNAARVTYTTNAWADTQDADTGATPLGIHYLDLPTAELTTGQVEFTLFWIAENRWEGHNYSLNLSPPVSSSRATIPQPKK